MSTFTNNQSSQNMPVYFLANENQCLTNLEFQQIINQNLLDQEDQYFIQQLIKGYPFLDDFSTPLTENNQLQLQSNSNEFDTYGPINLDKDSPFQSWMKPEKQSQHQRNQSFNEAQRSFKTSENITAVQSDNMEVYDPSQHLLPPSDVQIDQIFQSDFFEIQCENQSFIIKDPSINQQFQSHKFDVDKKKQLKQQIFNEYTNQNFQRENQATLQTTMSLDEFIQSQTYTFSLQNSNDNSSFDPIQFLAQNSELYDKNQQQIQQIQSDNSHQEKFNPNTQLMNPVSDQLEQFIGRIYSQEIQQQNLINNSNLTINSNNRTHRQTKINQHNDEIYQITPQIKTFSIASPSLDLQSDSDNSLYNQQVLSKKSNLSSNSCINKAQSPLNHNISEEVKSSKLGTRKALKMGSNSNLNSKDNDDLDSKSSKKRKIKAQYKEELNQTKLRGRPPKSPLVSINETQPEAKDIKSIIRKWRKMISKELKSNQNSKLLNKLLNFEKDEFLNFKALVISKGKYKANSLKNTDGSNVNGSSIKKEISQENEVKDIIGLLISSYNLRRLQKFFLKQIHREAFKHYQKVLEAGIIKKPDPEDRERLLNSLEFIIRMSDLMEINTREQTINQ
eukprot:403336839